MPPRAPTPLETAAQETAPADPSAAARQHFEAALALLERGLNEEAATSFFAMTRAYPSFEAPWLNLAITHVRAGRLDVAEQTLLRFLEGRPDHARAHNMLGIVHRKRGRFNEARAAYARALELDPGDPDVHLNLGILHDLYLQQPRRALAHYELYRHLGGGEPAVDHWLADLRNRLGEGEGVR